MYALSSKISIEFFFIPLFILNFLWFFFYRKVRHFAKYIYIF